MIIDSHCHLHDPAFEDTRGAVARATEHHGWGVVAVGCDPDTNRRTIEAASANGKTVWPAFGFHPERDDLTDDDLTVVESQVTSTTRASWRSARSVCVVQPEGAPDAAAPDGAGPRASSGCWTWRALRPAVIRPRRRTARADGAASTLTAKGVERAIFHWHKSSLDVTRAILDAGYLVSVTPAGRVPRARPRARRGGAARVAARRERGPCPMAASSRAWPRPLARERVAEEVAKIRRLPVDETMYQSRSIPAGLRSRVGVRRASPMIAAERLEGRVPRSRVHLEPVQARGRHARRLEVILKGMAPRRDRRCGRASGWRDGQSPRPVSGARRGRRPFSSPSHGHGGPGGSHPAVVDGDPFATTGTASSAATTRRDRRDLRGDPGLARARYSPRRHRGRADDLRGVRARGGQALRHRPAAGAPRARAGRGRRVRAHHARPGRQSARVHRAGARRPRGDLPRGGPLGHPDGGGSDIGDAPRPPRPETTANLGVIEGGPTNIVRSRRRPRRGTRSLSARKPRRRRSICAVFLEVAARRRCAWAGASTGRGWNRRPPSVHRLEWQITPASSRWCRAPRR